MTRAARVAGWWTLTALLACACLWSLADRLARQGVLLPLPTPFLTGGNARAAQAWAAYRRGDLATADRLARAALQRRPADATTLRIAGLVAIRKGEPARGDALMRLAGAAGWRDLPTQLYWAEVALNGGAFDVAAERLDALMRAVPAHPAPHALLRRMEASPAGRVALMRRLRQPNDWAGPYLANATALDAGALDARYALLTAALDAGVGPAPALLDQLGWVLIERGRVDLAARLAARTPGGDGGDFVADTGVRPGPFRWWLQAASGLDATVERRDGRGALHVTASGPALIPVASRMLRLPPGIARFEVAVTGARTAMPLVVTLVCHKGEGASAAPAAAPHDRAAALLTVPPGCPLQTLTLSIPGEEARRGADLWLSRPRVVSSAAADP